MQPNLLDTVPKFDGVTYYHEQDGKRLHKQLETVKAHMLRTGWQTLAEIHQATDVPEASASARLRDLRKSRFGSYTVERRRRTQGTHEYRVTL